MTESISLCLKTFDINASDAQADYFNQTVTTTKGRISNNRCTYTWFNVNLRNLLSDEWYNKYDKFNLRLISTTQSYFNSIIETCNVVSIKMSGLQWISSYDQSTGNDTGSVVVGVKNFNTYDDISNSNDITFRKGQQITNITITIDSISTDKPAIPDVDSTFGHMVFLFSISPVKD
jgi:hypothetical protein